MGHDKEGIAIIFALYSPSQKRRRNKFCGHFVDFDYMRFVYRTSSSLLCLGLAMFMRLATDFGLIREFDDVSTTSKGPTTH